MFPTNSILLTLSQVKIGTDEFGNDKLGDTVERVDGVILAPETTSDDTAPHELHDNVIVELHLPKSYSKSVRNSTFTVLDGPFRDRTFKIQGDSMPYAYSPLRWNRQVRAEEVY